MPYITQKERNKLDPIIDQLHERCQGLRGRINYCCTRLVHLWVLQRMAAIRSLVKKYNIVNDAHGILNCIADEFYNAVVIPYEKLKRKENGSVSCLDEYANGRISGPYYKCGTCKGTFEELDGSICPHCGSTKHERNLK